MAGTPQNTLLLDTDSWDLVIGANGNIAMASPPYAVAQDAASQIKTFQGEVYYDTTLGIPYFGAILGQYPPLSLIKSYVVSAAELTPGVVKARAFITSFDKRAVSGQVQILDSSGSVTAASFF
jgi:hypothetical protein